MVITPPTKPRQVPDLKQSDVRETSGVTAKPTIGDFTDSNHTHADVAGGGVLLHTNLTAGDGSDHADVVTNTSGIATNVTAIGLNTTHRGSNGSEHANVATNTSGIATNVTAIGLNTTHKGSNGSDHSLLANKTTYWSCGATAFIPTEPDTDDISYMAAGNQESVVTANVDNINFFATVNLPHGSVITGAVVYGTGGDWELNRVGHGGAGGDLMANAVVGTIDTTISNATVDNENFFYMLEAQDIDTGEKIYGARITYTTDYD